jgi:RimJ/RimL family protein N-acetyltransferase
VIIDTSRGRLRAWRDSDREAFAAMHADPEVMWDAVAPLSRAESDAKLERYRQVFAAHGFSRWAMEDRDGGFLGYVGLLPIPDRLQLGPGVEIGWRFRREAWGHGYATEGAVAALRDGFERCGFDEVLSYTAPDNLRSQRVMERLGLVRDRTRDFVAADGWIGWVWRTGA